MNKRDMLDYERIYLDNGATLIAGIDEAGRGPLAGPVVAACVIMPLDTLIEGVNDSKKLSAKMREKLYALIVEKAISYAVAEVDNSVIDEINILNATKQAMLAAVQKLSVKPDILLIDAVKLNTDIKMCPIISGDALSYSIAAASILAKVHRDRLMLEYAKEYSQYGMDKHKGYGTAEHIEALKTYGATPIHRKSFIKNFIEVK
ncbi:MAG: ribonuclease HII [Clostridia bacterium]|nr:ribonuclease HII [Clostridia bacterium]